MTIIATEEATDINVDNVDVKSVEAAEHVPVRADTAENVEEAREEAATVRPSIEVVFATAAIEKSNTNKITDAEINALDTLWGIMAIYVPL